MGPQSVQSVPSSHLPAWRSSWQKPSFVTFLPSSMHVSSQRIGGGGGARGGIGGIGGGGGDGGGIGGSGGGGHFGSAIEAPEKRKLRPPPPPSAFGTLKVIAHDETSRKVNWIVRARSSASSAFGSSMLALLDCFVARMVVVTASAMTWSCESRSTV